MLWLIGIAVAIVIWSACPPAFFQGDVMKYAAIAAALALAGCAPTMQDFQAQCQSYGFTYGSERFASCMQNETLAYRAQVGAALNAMATDNAIMMNTNFYHGPR